jgi:hypothetical protein
LPRPPREKSYSVRISLPADLTDAFFIRFSFAPARGQNANGKTFGQFRVASQSRERTSRADSTAMTVKQFGGALAQVLTPGDGEFVHQGTMFLNRQRAGGFPGIGFLYGFHTLFMLRV